MSDQPRRKSPAFQFYAASFLSSTADWTLKEVGAYIRLLSYQWDNGTIPRDPERLRLLLGCGKKELEKLWGTLLPKFVEHGEGYVNPRLEEERVKQAEFRAKASKAGQRGAIGRWGTPSKPHPKPNGVGVALKTVPVPRSISVTPERLFNTWNELTTYPIPRVKNLTGKRRQKLERRIEEVPDLKTWKALFCWVNTQDWMRGLTKRGWTVTLDWLINSEDVLNRYIERSATPTRQSEIEDSISSFLEEAQ